jgi:DNA-binding GntR family transcriptional regulator
MHSETIEALRRGDPTAAARAIEDDIQQGLDLMTQALGN